MTTKSKERQAWDRQRAEQVNARLFEAAHRAGMAAGEAARPMPMVVQERRNPFDDNSPVVREYGPIMDGVCGFAYITVRPGNCSFARYLKKRGGYHGYYGGTQYSVRHFGQSLERKQAYARAFAEVLSEAGIKAYSESRMD
jgi:hypothetical protein